RIVAAYDARFHIDAVVVVNCGTDDDHIPHHGRRGGEMVLAFDGDFDSCRQGHLAMNPEGGARPSARGIDGDQASVLCGHENGAMAQFTGLTIAVDPGCEPTASEGVSVVTDAIDPGIEGPFLTASLRVERDDAVERGHNVQRAVHQ